MSLLRLQPVACIALSAGMWLAGGGVAGSQDLQALGHQSWSTEAGLPQASVHQILQSRDGYLWIATEGGVARFDGLAFRVFNHETEPAFTSDDVSSVRQEKDGTLVFGTADGMVQLRGGEFHRVAESGSSRPTSAVSEDAAARGGASEHAVDGTAWSWSSREVTAPSGGGTMRWRVGAELPGTRVQMVYVDRSGTAWIGTNRGLVTAGTSSPHTRTVAALGGNSILSFLEDAEGNFWIGTETSGLHALRARAFREEAQVEDEEISAVVEGSDGSMWVGTRDDGLRHLEGGLVGFHSARAPALQALTSPIILALAPGKSGDVWAGTPDGLNHVEATGKVTRYTSSNGLPDDLVGSLAVAEDGSVWIGTRRGLAHLLNGRFLRIPLRNGLSDELIGVIYEAAEGKASGANEGGLWVGTLSGLFRIRGGEVRAFSREDGLSSSLITSLGTDAAGRLWVASRDRGLMLFGGARFSAIRVAGIPADVAGMVADRRGFLWLRMRGGVLRVSADELANCAEERVCHPEMVQFGMEDGLPSGELVPNGEPSAWETRAGSVWIATRKGLGIVDAGHLHRNPVPPPVVIERVTLDEQEVKQSGGAKVVANSHARYTFEYAGLSFRVPAKVLYRTRLEGFDRDWSSPTGRRMVTYTSLPPGDYTFRVMAANDDGLWNQAGAAFHFRVLPTVYRRWWFLLLVACALVAIAMLLYRLRVRRLRVSFDAVLAERNRIAREIHDTLAQDMVGATLQLDLVSQMLSRNLVSEAAAQVSNTRAMVHEGLQHARQSIWNLRANTAQDALPARIQNEAVRFTSHVLAVNVIITGAYRRLPAEAEGDVLRIVQEALSNVQRHSRATFAEVQVEYGQDKLMLQISDNGVGFAPHEVRSGHYGLEGMRERAAGLDGQLDVASAEGQGTTIKLIVPLARQRGPR